MRSKLFLRYTADMKKKAKEPLMYESTHLSVFALPPLSWQLVAMHSDLWSSDRTLILRAASPLQVLRQMTRYGAGG